MAASCGWRYSPLHCLVQVYGGVPVDSQQMLWKSRRKTQCHRRSLRFRAKLDVKNLKLVFKCVQIDSASQQVQQLKHVVIFTTSQNDPPSLRKTTYQPKHKRVSPPHLRLMVRWKTPQCNPDQTKLDKTSLTQFDCSSTVDSINYVFHPTICCFGCPNIPSCLSIFLLTALWREKSRGHTTHTFLRFLPSKLLPTYCIS